MSEKIFQPEGYIRFCEQLLSNSDLLNDEPLFRTVVNRCYLDAYMTAKSILIRENYIYQEDHTNYQAVERHLREYYDQPDGRILQERLSTLRNASCLY